MFWGNKDTSVTFCEETYKNSKYVAEFYNTLSGISYSLVGLYFYKQKMKDIGLILIILGLGTCILHATQRFYGQWLDEGSMITLCFFIIKKLRLRLNKTTENKILYFLLIGYLYLQRFFCYFLILFTGLLIYIYRLAQKIDINKKYFQIYLYVFIFSAVCWALDQVMCQYVKLYYLHAVWHIGTSIAIYFGVKSIL